MKEAQAGRRRRTRGARAASGRRRPLRAGGGRAPAGGTAGAAAAATAVAAVSAQIRERSRRKPDAEGARRRAKLRLDLAPRARNRYVIEIHKKFSLAAACLIFVLIGAPIALRFPRGGVGLVIGVSLLVFALYYVGLIGGESLANDGLVPPFWAMWGTNVILTSSGSCCCCGWARIRRRTVAVTGARARRAAGAARRAAAPAPERAMRLVRPLDRYVFVEWVKIFLATALGLPILLVIIDLTDNLEKYLDRNLPWPTSRSATCTGCRSRCSWSLPAAVLFATVFSIGTLHPPFRDHGGEGERDQLLPAHRADHGRRGAGGGARPRDRRAGADHDGAATTCWRRDKVTRGHRALQLRLRGGVRPRLQGADADVTAGHDGAASRSSGRGAGRTTPRWS